ncbi:hypothetical protein HAX54_005784 [Datura stramonium]|uniref:Uncharacterized protein n=1 Tax=Datura stramonium TaxID=4076 RepID=A0ABS8WXR1_DATST|nr:hypothetical protein [Datura stramonium]
MDSFLRLQEISIEISRVEEENLQSEQRLGLLWENFPPLDPEAVANMMRLIWNHIRGLEGRKEASSRNEGNSLLGLACASSSLALILGLGSALSLLCQRRKDKSKSNRPNDCYSTYGYSASIEAEQV